ncbi:hypothetical protein HY407_04785 [Candidatus Gottesmanbacteria bacterium]|nr:hypothetical protein [Candidatus Gottesmanbacteria bacterium]
MSEIIDEAVSVVTIYNKNGQVWPWKIKWNERIYNTIKIGFHQPLRQGRKLLHIFSVLTDSQTSFRLMLDTETLHWRLSEVVDESTS